jgi:hypothetical protein
VTRLRLARVLSFHRTAGVSLGAGALLLLGGQLAVAQEPDRLAQIVPNCRHAYELVIDSATTLELPTRSLRSVMYEGLEKKVDCKKVVDVVRKQLGLLVIVRQTLGPVSDDEYEAAGAVLRAGAKPEQLKAFRARPKNRSDLSAFMVWADLITRGVPSEDAHSAVTKLWQEGADDATFVSLWKNVQSDILQGLNPGTALQNRIRETPGRPSPSTVKPPEGQQENLSSR